MNIRPAQPRDVPAIAAIVERAYAVYVPRIGRRPGPMDDDYEAKVRDGEVFVADDGSVAGLVVLLEQPDHLLVENVAVDPGRQGAGIGRALLAHADAEAVRRGLGELRLYTNEAMTENIDLYRRLGWRETGRRAGAGFRRVYFSKEVAGGRP